MFINVIVCWCVVAMGNWALQLFEVPCLVYSLPVFSCELSSLFCQQLSGEAATWLSNQQEHYLAVCLVRKSPGHCILVTSVCVASLDSSCPYLCYAQSVSVPAFLHVSLCYCNEDYKCMFSLAKAVVKMERVSLIMGQGEKGWTLVIKSR